MRFVTSKVGFKTRRFFSDRLLLRTARCGEDTSTEIFNTKFLSDEFRTRVTSRVGFEARSFFPDRLQLLSVRSGEKVSLEL